jgi:DNA damage-binding protein 1
MSSPTATATSKTAAQSKSSSAGRSTIAREVSHYVVTAHPPGGVLFTCKGHFVASHSGSCDVIVAKSRRLELRTWQSTSSDSNDSSSNNNNNNNKTSLFPVVATAPIHGRLTCLQTLKMKKSSVDMIFVTTDRHQYAVLSYDPTMRPYPFRTHASGRLPSGDDPNLLGRPSESGPLVAMDPLYRCVALHWLDGLITVIPIDQNYNPPPLSAEEASGHEVPAYWPKSAAGTKTSCLKEPFHVRMEERTLLNMVFLETNNGYGYSEEHAQVQIPPQLTLLHQDSRGTQHVYTHSVDLRKHNLSSGNLKRSRVDGGSSWMIPVPVSRPILQPQAGAAADNKNPNAPQFVTLGGVIILGQRQITYANATTTKMTPIPPCLFLNWDALPDDPKGMPRYLLADEFGNLHMLSFLTYHARVVALTMETLGSCGLCHSLQYLGEGLTFVGSTLGDSQLVQIHEEPIRNNVEAAATVASSIMMEDEHSVANTEDATAAAGNNTSELEWMGDSSYLTVVEEYTHLGPIVDFDLVPTAPGLANSNTANQPSQVVTASGTSRAGSIRLIRNGIGMNEYASVEMPGIQAMWSVREAYASPQDAFLVQSFVGQTRVLGVTKTVVEEDDDENKQMANTQNIDDDEEEEAGGTLEEVELPGLEANATSLYVGNVQPGDRILQITESEIRLISLPNNMGEGGGVVLDTWSPPETAGSITVAAGNEAGQAVVATPGGTLWYLVVNDDGTKLESLHQKQMDREVSCLDVHPFASNQNGGEMMDTSSSDLPKLRLPPNKSTIVAVGLWDDFSVRLLALTHDLLEELHQIHLSTDEEEEELEDPAAMMSTEESAIARRHRNNMMARSLCLITLDVSSSSHGHGSGGGHSSSLSSTQGVDMLFVGLGDGTVVSFAVVLSTDEASEHPAQRVSVQSKKEVCLGTQRINLIPLQTEWGGTCVLATGDRPTVIYLAGVGSGATSTGGGSGTTVSFNPKLCYSNVNLQVAEEEEAENVSRSASQQTIAVNVAAPFFSSLLFDAGSLGSQYYSLCVADDANLRLGVIDDIQKLHVTTCRLGMAPRRIVHCPDSRMFAVGCIESGIKQLGLGGEEHNMGNCVRFLDDTTFDDIER